MTGALTNNANSNTSGTVAPLVLITGASRGIGKALVMAFAAAGLDVLGVARNKQNLQKLKAAFSEKYPNRQLYIHLADLSSKVAAEALATAALKLQRPITVLINNVGAFIPDNLQDKTDFLPQQIATNLYSAYYLTRSLLPTFVNQKAGYIFNICSVASLQAYPRGASYCISKYALRGFSHVLREEMRVHGVRVSTVLPGAVLTDSWRGTDLPNTRFIQADDIARALLAAYHLSDSATVEEIVIRPQLGDI